MLRSPTALIWLISLLGLGIRLAAVALFVGFGEPPKNSANPDQTDYEMFAWEMVAGQGFAYSDGTLTGCRPPGTCFTLAAIYSVFGRSYAVARLMMCLMGAATIALAGFTAKRVFGPASGVWAALLLAIYPGHFYYSIHLLSEVPFGLYLMGALYVSLLAMEGRYGWSLACGVLWGMSILTRPNMTLAVAMVAAVWLLAHGLSGQWGQWRGRLVRVGLLSLGCAATITPWVVRNQVVFGKASVCTIVAGYTFWGAHNDRMASEANLYGYWIETSELIDAEHPIAGTEVEREQAAWRYGKQWVADNWQLMPSLTLYKLWRLVWPFSEMKNPLADLVCRAGWLLVAPFVAVGLCLAIRRRPAETMVLLAPVAATLATAVVFYGCSRFRDAVVPALVCFGGLAASELAQWLWARFRPAEPAEQLTCELA